MPENYRPRIYSKKNGERAGTRTLDRRIKSPLLYQLSYTLADLRQQVDGGRTLWR